MILQRQLCWVSELVSEGLFLFTVVYLPQEKRSPVVLALLL